MYIRNSFKNADNIINKIRTFVGVIVLGLESGGDISSGVTSMTWRRELDRIRESLPYTLLVWVASFI